jgi:uncharacterized membrane protein YraQ (UPF0718 family)
VTLTISILSTVALALFVLNKNENGKQIEGLKIGAKQFLQTLPLILGAFALAGMIEVLIPKEFAQEWLSAEAGLRGIILGTVGGMLLAMGPYAAFPIIASILASGAGLGTVVALTTSWCLLGLSKAPFEASFFGLKFYIYKTVFSIPFCLAAGLIAHAIDLLIS